MTQVESIGFGNINSLHSILTDFSSRKIFIVTGKRSYACCGAAGRLGELLKNYEFCTFSDFAYIPKIVDLRKGLKLFGETDCDTILAVGGGSVIDMAKLLNFFGSNDIDPEQYFRNPEQNFKKGRALIAVPTTAGSGSEATQFAVLYINNQKRSVDNGFLLPDVSIVDAQFTLSLPPYPTAFSGMDALSQAIESYWCVYATALSQEFAKKAIELIRSNLLSAVTAPTPACRLAMAQAAHLAGKAINITRTTAPHAVSYPLTAFFNIPHGHAAGVLMPSFLVYNFDVTAADVLDPRGPLHVQKTILEICRLLDQVSPAAAKQWLDNLMHHIGLKTRLYELSITSDQDIELIIENGLNPERVKNNPRKLTENALRKILHDIR